MSKQRRVLVKKRCSSNIAAIARDHATHGLGISTSVEEAMHHDPSTSISSEDAGLLRGPPSAIPRPLNVSHPRSGESLPATEELDAFLSLHMHVDHGMESMHRFVNHKFHENMHSMNEQYNQTMEVLATSFADMLNKVNGVTEQSSQTQGALDSFKVEMNAKIMDLADLVQNKVSRNALSASFFSSYSCLLFSFRRH